MGKSLYSFISVEGGKVLNFPEIAEQNPMHIWIEPTTRCNSRCKYCEHWHREFGEDMDRGIYDKIRNQILSDVKWVDLIGYGEPFIANLFWEMFDECVKRNIEISTTTNGLPLLKEEILPKIVRNRITITLSIDGATKEAAEFARPFIKWEQLIRILELLKHYGEEAGDEKHFKLRFNFVAMKKNIGDLPGLVRLASRYGADEIFILPLGNEREMEQVRGQGLTDAPELASPAFLQALKLGYRLGVAISVPPCYRSQILQGKERGKGVFGKLQYTRRLLSLSFLSLKKYGVTKTLKKIKKRVFPGNRISPKLCEMPWEDSYIAADGTVYPCCLMGEKLGNLKKETWEDIWNGKNYRNLRRTIHSWNPSFGCRYCALPVGITGGDPDYYKKYFRKFKRQNIPLDSTDIKFKNGFYELETDEKGKPHHIWMGQKGNFSLPKPKGAKFLEILIFPRTPNPEINPGRGIINQGEKEFFDNTCEDIHFPLEGEKGNRLEVCLEMENEYHVENDNRGLSLSIKEINFLF